MVARKHVNPWIPKFPMCPLGLILVDLKEKCIFDDSNVE